MTASSRTMISPEAALRRMPSHLSADEAKRILVDRTAARLVFASATLTIVGGASVRGKQLEPAIVKQLERHWPDWWVTGAARLEQPDVELVGIAFDDSDVARLANEMKLPDDEGGRRTGHYGITIPRLTMALLKLDALGLEGVSVDSLAEDLRETCRAVKAPQPSRPNARAIAGNILREVREARISGFPAPSPAQ